MTTEQYKIEDFIPQRRPMLLVDEFVSSDWNETRVRTTVRDSWPLVENGKVDPVVLIEVVAQTAGVLAGWRKRDKEKQGGRGWLVGVRRTDLTGVALEVGDVLDSYVKVSYELENYAVFQGRVELHGKEIARVEIQTFQPDDSFWSQENDYGK